MSNSQFSTAIHLVHVFARGVTLPLAMSASNRSRSYLLPKGCTNLAELLKPKAATQFRPPKSKPLETNEQIRQVVHKYIPELANGTLEIVSTARVVGCRCLLVVRPASTTELPARLVSLSRGPQLNALIEELGGEVPSFRRWNPSAEEFIRQSFLGSEVKVALNPAEKSAIVTLNKRVFNEIRGNSSAITRDSLLRLQSEMVQLISEVTGWKISLETADA